MEILATPLVAAPSSRLVPTRKPTRKLIRLFLIKPTKLGISTHRSNTRGVCVKSCVSSKGGIGVERVEMDSGSLRDGDAIVIVDHGSRRQESNLMLNEFVEMFKGQNGYQIVEPAHMELAEPSIKDAFRRCVEQGAKRIIVSPFFLFPGRHWHQDIPSLAAEAAEEHSGVSYIVTAPLGLHELLVDVMNDRIKQCLSHVAGDAEECDVCSGTGKCRAYGLS